jgi:hypothetical protein
VGFSSLQKTELRVLQPFLAVPPLAMAKVSSPATHNFIKHDASSSSTQALLYYLLNRRPGTDNESKLSFSYVKNLVGDIPRQIPDESEPLKQELITLIDNGFPDKITGKKVSHLP